MHNRQYSFILLFIATLLLFMPYSCSDESSEDLSAEELLAYIATNNLNTQATDSGLHYIIEDSGLPTEERIDSLASTSSLVVAQLKGSLIDGTVFGDSYAGPISPLVIDIGSNIISGLKEGLRLFKREASGQLLIPATLAYGESGDSNLGIPPNAAVIFQIEMLDIYANESVYNDSIIQHYIVSNNIEIDTVYNDLNIIISAVGDLNSKPTSSNTVIINCKASFLSGLVFKDTYISNATDTIDLSTTIDGLSDGLQLFGVGGSGAIIIPSQEAYGAEGTDTIPSFTPIIYEIELLSILE